MRINEVITESEQLDELGAGLARGVGKLAGGIPGAAMGMWDAAKQGYADTRSAISGVTAAPAPSASRGGSAGSPSSGSAAGGAGGTAAGGSAGAAGAAGGAPEANDQQAKIGVGQINKILPSLRLRDLQSVKKTLDAAILAKSRTPAPAAGGAPAGGGRPAPAPGGAPAGGAARPRGQEVDLGGKKYRWAGAQWVDVGTGRVADRATAAQLNNTPTS